jgi:hypothetical protein
MPAWSQWPSYLFEYGATVDPGVDSVTLCSELGTPGSRAAVAGPRCQCRCEPQTEDRWTALHWAAEWENLQLVDVLLKHGADPRSDR